MNDVSDASSLKGSNYSAVLGFNEPNAQNQANMSPQQACDNWEPIVQTGLRLGSPAATQWGAFSWTPQFLSCIKDKGLKAPDFLCFHYYSYSGYSISKLDTFLANVSTQYPQYRGKIWITEFANGTGNAQQNMDFFNGFYDLITGKYAGLVER